MAKKKKYKSPQRKQYEHELYLLKNRQRTWVKTKHYILPEIKKKKSNESYSKAAERLHGIRLSSFTKEQKEQYSKNYEIKYEAGDLTTDKKYNEPYTPPSENDFYESDYDYDNYWWEETENEPADEKAEYAAEIERLIDEIVVEADPRSGREYVRNILHGILNNSRTMKGDEEFYKTIKDNDTLGTLQKIADEAINRYIKKGEDAEGIVNSLISQFATVLNDNRPLTDEQSYTLEMYGTISFDYDE